MADFPDPLHVALRRMDPEGADRIICDRLYAVLLDGVRIGEVARDDIEPGVPGAARHLWHAWIDPIPGGEEQWGPWDEAVGERAWTRAEAVHHVLVELAELCDRVGLVEGAAVWAALRAARPRLCDPIDPPE